MSSSEWNSTSLGKIAEIIMGQSPTGETCNDDGIGAPLLNGPTEFGNSYPDPVQYTTDPKKFSQESDLLFCVRGSTTGKMNWSDQKYAIGRGLAAIRHKNGKDYQPFLKGLIEYNLPVLLAEATGSTFPNVSSQQLSSLAVEIPDLPTQRRIADILSALDEKIDLNRQTNATLEAIAQAIFEEWFVDFNFPGVTGEMVESELGMIPSGWRVAPLDEIANFLNGLALQKFPPENESESLPVIKIRELKNGVTDSSDKASRNIPEKYIINDGDLIFSWSGTLEVRFWVGGEGALNQHLFNVTSEQYPLWFCYFWVLHHLEEFRNIAADKTTTMGHIQRKHLTEAMCLIPDNLGEMNKIAQPIFEKIISTQQETATLAALRNNLLPKLMNGEIPV